MTLLEQLRDIRHQPQGPTYKALHELCGEAAAEIERLRVERDDAKADALRLHEEKMKFFDALLEIRCRDDRNGGLHQNYRDIIDRALGNEQQPPHEHVGPGGK